MTLKERFLKLVKEPSTAAGVAAALGGMAVFGLSGEQWGEVIGSLMMLLGAIAAGKLDPADVEKDSEE